MKPPHRSDIEELQGATVQLDCEFAMQISGWSTHANDRKRCAYLQKLLKIKQLIDRGLSGKEFSSMSDPLKDLVNFTHKQQTHFLFSIVTESLLSRLFEQILNDINKGSEIPKDIDPILAGITKANAIREAMKSMFQSFDQADLDQFFTLMFNAKKVSENKPLREVFEDYLTRKFLPEQLAEAYTKFQTENQKNIFGVPVITLDKVLVPVEQIERNDPKGGHEWDGDAPKIVNGKEERQGEKEDDPVVILIQGFQEQGVKVDEVLEGKKLNDKSIPNYRIVVVKELNAQILVSPDHRTYVLREPMDFEHGVVSQGDVHKSESSYITAGLNPNKPESWIKSILYYSKMERDVLGIQNKAVTDWADSAESLKKAFKGVVAEKKGVHFEEGLSRVFIKSDNPSINGKSWNAASIALRYHRIKGLEHIGSLRELYFEICREDPAARDLVPNDWWNSRRTSAESAFLARLEAS